MSDSGLFFNLHRVEFSGCVEQFPAAVDVFCVGGRVPTESSGCLHKVTAGHFTGAQRLVLLSQTQLHTL